MEPEQTPEVPAQPEAESQVTRPPGEEESQSASPLDKAETQPVIEEAEDDESETSEEEGELPAKGERRVRVRTRTNWLLTAIIGVGTLLLGAMGGYVAHSVQTAPTLEQLAKLEAEATVTSATATAAAAQPSAQQQPTPDMKGILAMLVSKTRHFKGDANAPVTMLEFSDFQ